MKKLIFICVLAALFVACRNEKKTYKSAIVAIRSIENNPRNSDGWLKLIRSMDDLEGNAALTENVITDLSRLTKNGTINQKIINQLQSISDNDRSKIQWMFDTSFYAP